MADSNRMWCKQALVTLVMFCWWPSLAIGADGQLEINQACAAAGCFPGDAPGFPVEVTNPGSYRLTSDLTPPAGNVNGIVLSADDVTLDLNGFGLLGSNNASSIGIQLLARRAIIGNGTVHDFGTGVRQSGGGGLGDNSRVSDLTVSSARNFGILLGAQSLVADCDIDSEFNGIILGDRSLARGNRVNMTDPAFTNSSGISVGSVGRIEFNVINGAPGFGVVAGYGSTVSGNSVSASRRSGILLDGNGAVVEGNTFTNSQEFGIAFDGTTNHLVRGNNAFDNNQSGGAFTNIEACATCTLVDNHAP